MKMEENRRKTNVLVVLLLFGMFAVCILAVLLTGAEAYGRLARRDRQSYDRRTAAQYLTARIRQSDRQGGVQVRPWGDGDALVFTEQIDSAEYETGVYCYGGYLRELFAAAGTQLSPDAGEKVLQIQSLTAKQEGNLITLRLTGPDGEEQELVVYLRSTQEVTP